MKHLIFRVTSFEIHGAFTLRVTFDDGVSRIIDFSKVLKGELLGALRDPAVFAQVQVDPEAHTLVWPNGADFDPATLHDWPQYADLFAAQASRWSAERPVVAEKPTRYGAKKKC